MNLLQMTYLRVKYFRLFLIKLFFPISEPKFWRCKTWTKVTKTQTFFLKKNPRK